MSDQRHEHPTNQQSPAEPQDGERGQRLPYEAPQVLKKRSVLRVTLFSGGGVSATGLTASG